MSEKQTRICFSKMNDGMRVVLAMDSEMDDSPARPGYFPCFWAEVACFLERSGGQPSAGPASQIGKRDRIEAANGFTAS